MSQSNIIKYVQKRIIDKIYNYQMKNIWLNNKYIPMTFSLFFLTYLFLHITEMYKVKY